MAYLLTSNGQMDIYGNILFKGDSFFNEIGISFKEKNQDFTIVEIIELFSISGIDIDDELDCFITESCDDKTFLIFKKELIKSTIKKVYSKLLNKSKITKDPNIKLINNEYYCVMKLEDFKELKPFLFFHILRKNGDFYLSLQDLISLLDSNDKEKDIVFKNKQQKKVKTYVMIDHNTGYYKIGKSIDLKLRERTLQSQKPTIELILFSDCDIENDLHKKHKDKRIRGEWFNLDADDILELIECFGFNKTFE